VEYIQRLTIPANTAKADAERLDFKLPYGILNRVEIAFPPGPKGLAHAQFYHTEFQFLPSNPEESYAWDATTIVWEGEYDLPESWNYCSLRGWNLDDTYEHTVTCRVVVGGRKWTWEDLLALQTPMTVLEE